MGRTLYKQSFVYFFHFRFSIPFISKILKFIKKTEPHQNALSTTNDSEYKSVTVSKTHRYLTEVEIVVNTLNVIL